LPQKANFLLTREGEYGMSIIAIFHVIAEIFEIPAIILGSVALIGLLLQKKRADEVIKGTVKTILGLLILSGGSGIIAGALTSFAGMFDTFGFKGVVPFDEAIVGGVIAAVQEVAIATSIIMACGFIVNLILARITPFKYIFLTGHMIWIMAASLAWAFYDLKLSLGMIILFGSIIQGMIGVILPAIAQPIMRKLTGGNKIAYSHLTTLGVCCSGYVGKLLGDKKNNAEDIKMPKGLDFFRDVAVSLSITMFAFYIIVAIIVRINSGIEVIREITGGQNFVLFTFVRAFTFAAGVLVLLQGVRMFIGEIVPAFHGVALKVIPGAIPALDCPVTFQYGPTSLMLGFIFAVIGMLAGMTVSLVMGLTVPLPAIIGAFFTGGVSGLFGNTLGGRRGACIAGFVYGLICTIPVALFYPLYGTYGVSGLSLLCSDVLVVLAIIKLAFATNPIIVGLIALALFVSACVIISRKQAVSAPSVESAQ
jgi:PTS system ascorbate-specific IIC component